MRIRYQEDRPAAEAFHELFATTGWNNSYRANVADLERALAASWCVVAAYDGDQLVGIGRVVSDGVLYAMVYDMIVRPSHQRQGIGAEILRRLVARCRTAGIRNVQLFSAAGISAFYEKRGFIARPADRPGMTWLG
jgi:GNAT superfamily N-acetyltransferase